MKTKTPLSVLFTFSFLLSPCLAQVPQSFNYQAIARDGSGNPITGATMQVKIGILSDTIANTMVWEELFNPVKTNAFGMFTIVVGTGVKQSGSAATFNAIDWTKTPLFLRTSIYYPSSWKVMGTSKLQSVPYSMVAANLEGTVPLLSVKGNTTTMDSALFVVRNNTGQIVFAVYNEGVRIYVDDGVAKGATKGGFAIGSFDRSKGTTQPLFVVDPDSIRAYLDNNPLKAVKGGFAIGGFDKSKATGNQQFFTVSDDSIRMYIDDNLISKSRKGGFAIGSFDKSKGGNVNYLNVSTDSSGIINPSQNRILWYPTKNAFLTGKVLIESQDSVGVNSFASGYESKAIGQYSQALGYKPIARGDYSTAIGNNALARKRNSFAFGDSARAINLESYAIGRGAAAIGYRSFAFGSAGFDSTGQTTNVAFAYAIGDYSFAIGQGSQSVGKGAFALGISNVANGDFSTALGFFNKANGNYSTAMGNTTHAIGNNSTAMGYSTQASEDYSTAMGNSTQALGMNSTAMGYGTVASGYNSTALGNQTKANGTFSTSMGFYTKAGADNSTAMGYFTTAPSYCETVIGSYNTEYTPLSMTGWNASDRLFVIGNGWSTPSNAVTVLKNGNVGIGTSTPLRTLHLSSSTSSNEFIMEVQDGLVNWKKWNFYINGGTGNAQNLYLRILNDAGTTSSRDVMTWLSGGNVGIGTTSPIYPLDVLGTTLFGNRKESVGTDATVRINNNGPLNSWYYTRTRGVAAGGFGVLGTGSNVYISNLYNGDGNFGNASYSITLNANGNVGIGTSTPLVRLEVIGTTKSVTTTGIGSGAGQFQSWTDGSAQGLRSVYSFYPTFQATSDNSPRRAADIVSGFNAGAWGNEYLTFNVGYNGSSNDAQNLTSEKMRIIGNGNVGIGTAVPGYKLTVNGTAWCSSGTWSGSDIRWKKNITEINDVLSNVLTLKPVTYQWRADEFPEMNFTNDVQIGLIAQDVEKVFPSLVMTDNNGYKAVSYEKLSVVLLEGMKEQQKQIKDQQQQIESTNQENQQLKSQVQSLQGKVGQIESQQKEIDELKTLVNTFVANQTGQGNK